MLASHLDPVQIRKVLVAQRAQGIQFDVAWIVATRNHSVLADERTVYAFMRGHFRAAYYDTPSSLGRCRIPGRDVSAAIACLTSPATGMPLDGSRLDRPIPRSPSPRFSSHRGYCRSGDDCDRPATRGRFGRTFCEHHGAELEHLSRLLAVDGGFNQGTIAGSKGLAA